MFYVRRVMFQIIHFAGKIHVLALKERYVRLKLVYLSVAADHRAETRIRQQKQQHRDNNTIKKNAPFF